MKAAVCRAFGEPLTIEDIEIAAPGPGEIKVKMAACAICHSDIHAIEGAWGGELPIVYGHEAAGVVEEFGDGVTTLKPGDHAVVTLIRSCGHCHFCSQGAPTACEIKFPLDVKSPLTDAGSEPVTHGFYTGAFAEYAVIDSSQAVKIPDDISLDSASLLACGVITGYGAVTNTVHVPPGALVAVIGTGGVGLNSIQGAAIAGAGRVIAIDLNDDKLATAKDFGATDTINPQTQDLSKEIKAATGGRKCDYVFVTVGSTAAMNQAYRLMGIHGTTVLVGMPESGAKSEIDPLRLSTFRQTVMGSLMGSSRIQVDIPHLIELYRQGRLKLDELITGRYPLDQINEAIASVNRGEALRNVIVFD